MDFSKFEASLFYKWEFLDSQGYKLQPPSSIQRTQNLNKKDSDSQCKRNITHSIYYKHMYSLY